MISSFIDIFLQFTSNYRKQYYCSIELFSVYLETTGAGTLSGEETIPHSLYHILTQCLSATPAGC